MYRSCIFCSKDLGTNDVIEEFPVGSQIAFDASRGRLWAVCRHCQRWNLAPIEERWEAVEEAEKQFATSRLRVQSENIGMAKMRDGTRLVRIGSAMAGEVAAWRYGRQIVARRRKAIYVGAAVGAASIGILAGFPLLAAAGLPTGLFNMGFQVANFSVGRRNRRRVILHLSAIESPTGAELTLRAQHLGTGKLTRTAEGLTVMIPGPGPARPWYKDPYARQTGDGPLVAITGPHGRSLAGRIMAVKNGNGASQKAVTSAVNLLESVGSAQLLVDRVISQNPTVFAPQQNGDERTLISPAKILGTWDPGSHLYRPIPESTPRALHPTTALALEMALHDESERRAMEGELQELEAAWRDAEYIARIADALPDDPPED